MPAGFDGNSRQRIQQVVKAVSVSIDYVLTITNKSISPDARAELTALMLGFFWEVDSSTVLTRAIDLLTESGTGTGKMENNNITELFKKSVTPATPVAPVYNIEFRENNIEKVVFSQQPNDKDRDRDD